MHAWMLHGCLPPIVAVARGARMVLSGHACSSRGCRRCPAKSLAEAGIRTSLSVNELSVTVVNTVIKHTLAPQSGGLGSQHHDTLPLSRRRLVSLTCRPTRSLHARPFRAQRSCIGANSYCTYCHPIPMHGLSPCHAHLAMKCSVAVLSAQLLSYRMHTCTGTCECLLGMALATCMHLASCIVLQRALCMRG